MTFKVCNYGSKYPYLLHKMGFVDSQFGTTVGKHPYILQSKYLQQTFYKVCTYGIIPLPTSLSILTSHVQKLLLFVVCMNVIFPQQKQHLPSTNYQGHHVLSYFYPRQIHILKFTTVCQKRMDTLTYYGFILFLTLCRISEL